MVTFTSRAILIFQKENVINYSKLLNNSQLPLLLMPTIGHIIVEESLRIVDLLLTMVSYSLVTLMITGSLRTLGVHHGEKRDISD